jgi:MFS family permease
MTTSSPPRPWILAVCCLAQFMTLLDLTVVNVALPSIRGDLGLSTAGLAWVVNAYTLALAGFLLLGGRAADLLGRREVLAGGLALFGVASLAGGLAQDGATLVAARAAQGLGGAVVAPAGLSILVTTFAAGRERNGALAWWGTLGGLGGASGALVGGVLTDALSWRWVLLAGAPVCLAAALAALRVVPALGRPPGAARSFDLTGAACVTAGLVLVTYAVGNVPGAPAAGGTLGPLAAGCALLALFALVEGRLAAAPLVPLQAFRSRVLCGASAVVLCLGAVGFSLWFLVTLLLQQVLGLSAAQTGLAFVPLSLSIVVATRVASRLATGLGPERVIVAGMALLGLGMALLSRVGDDATWAPDVLVPTLLCSAGIGASFVPATIAATSATASADAGLTTGVLNTAYQVGSSLGLALLASIAAGGDAAAPGADGFRAAFAAGACLAVAGAAVALVVLVRPWASRGGARGGRRRPGARAGWRGARGARR